MAYRTKAMSHGVRIPAGCDRRPFAAHFDDRMAGATSSFPSLAKLALRSMGRRDRAWRQGYSKGRDYISVRPTGCARCGRPSRPTARCMSARRGRTSRRRRHAGCGRRWHRSARPRRRTPTTQRARSSTIGRWRRGRCCAASRANTPRRLGESRRHAGLDRRAARGRCTTWSQPRPRSSASGPPARPGGPDVVRGAFAKASDRARSSTGAAGRRRSPARSAVRTRTDSPARRGSAPRRCCWRGPATSGRRCRRSPRPGCPRP